MTSSGRPQPELLLRVIHLRDEADAVARSLIDGQPIVGQVSLRLPVLEPAELGFLRAVAWLYVQYYEAGLVGVRFLVSLFDGFSIDEGGDLRDHVVITSRLRTYLQHNLTPTSESDTQTSAECEEWFARSCGSRVPGTEAHWTRCLNVLLTKAGDLFGALLQAVRCIESDEARDVLVEQWMFRIKRHHPAASFDILIEQAAADLGRSHIDVVKFRKRHLDRFVEALGLLDGEYDFEREARLLIEQALLTDVIGVLPISGTDIIQHFQIQPGPWIGLLLDWATGSYRSSPCDGDELLRRLGQAISDGELDLEAPRY